MPGKARPVTLGRQQRRASQPGSLALGLRQAREGERDGE